MNCFGLDPAKQINDVLKWIAAVVVPWLAAWANFFGGTALALMLCVLIGGCQSTQATTKPTGFEPGPQRSDRVELPLGDRTLAIEGGDRERTIHITGEELTAPPAGGLIPGGKNVEILVTASPEKALLIRKDATTSILEKRIDGLEREIKASVDAFERVVDKLSDKIERGIQIAQQIQASKPPASTEPTTRDEVNALFTEWLKKQLDKEGSPAAAGGGG